ncbi:MAG TPA: PAS domain S-box protein [Bacilli bacterium]|nr:PAS domain S-box protein [Bacilli bacterium]
MPNQSVTTQKKLDLYSLISSISSTFARAQKEDADATLNKTLELLCEFVTADRAYIFTYDFKANTCSNTHEYCSRGILPVIDTLQDIPLGAIGDWVSAHLDGKALYIPDVFLRDPKDGVRQILEPQGVQSLITIPFFNKDELAGFLGFDSVKQKRSYTRFEQEVLFEFSHILVNFLKRIELENQLSTDRIRYEYIITASNIGAWEWKVQTGEVAFNHEWAHMLGYTIEELAPITIDTWKRLTHPDDLKKASQNLNAVFEKRAEDYHNDIRMFHKDGSIVWVRDSGKVILWRNETPLLMIGTHIDITKQKQEEERLRIIKHAIESSLVGVIITGADNLIQYTNPYISKLTGYTEEEMLGQKPAIFKSGYHDKDFYDELWKQLGHGHEWVGEFKNRRKSGEIYWESASIAPIFDETGNLINYIGIKVDITEKKYLESIEKVNQAKLRDDFALILNNLEESHKSTVLAMAKLTESRDYETGTHVERVQYLCKTLAVQLKLSSVYKNEINTDFINDIFYASALHDIGKIRIKDAVLLKPDRLSPEEFGEMKLHVKYGADTLAEMVKLFPDNTITVMAVSITRYHHERWDGKGYLEGLKGTTIPLAARIMTVVDVYDAIRSKRPYKEAMSHETALAEIQKGAGTQFDPEIVEVFIKSKEKIRIIYESLDK